MVERFSYGETAALIAGDSELSEVVETIERLESVDYRLGGDNDTENTQIFTPAFLVDGMIRAIGFDTVVDIANTILEPTSGDGAFTGRILQHRLDSLNGDIGVVDVFRAISTIYSIEKDHDLIRRQRNNIYTIAMDYIDRRISPLEKDEDLTLRFLIARNFIEGETNIDTPLTDIVCELAYSTGNRDCSVDIPVWSFGDDGYSLGEMESPISGFDIILGNPPYQVHTKRLGSNAQPIYQDFVRQALSLQPRYLCMVIPSRWMTGGKGLDDFRSQMLFDHHISILHDYLDPKECFPNNDIKGGVCYFVWDRDHSGKADIYTHTADGSETKRSVRYLADGDSGIFIRFPELIDIKNKVWFVEREREHSQALGSIVSASKPYGLRAETMENAKKYGLSDFSTSPIPGGYRIFGLGENQKRTWKYIPHDYPLPRISSCLNKFKVFIAEAYGCGAIGEVPSTPVLSTPGELCTETFLEIGPFDTREEAANLISYIKTKFFRCLVGIQKQTQHATKKVYRFVPLQDFTDASDIDWSQSIAEIGAQLYRKYELDDREIRFIETNIKEWE